MQPQRLLTVKELSSYLGVSPCTVRRLVKERDIPFIRRKGLGIRFLKEEVDAWLSRDASKPSAFLECALNSDVALENYDRLFLKGGVKMSPKGKTWNYPFGSVYFRLTKSGQERWYIYYRIDGKRVRKVVKGAQCRADALKVLQVEVADAFRGKHGFAKQERAIKFKDFAALYLEHSKLQKRSWHTDKCRIESHLEPFFGEMDLKDITSQSIESYRAKRLETGVKRSTTNRELALMKVMYSKAIDWRYCPENPVRRLKLFAENDNQIERILGPGEEKRLFEASAEHLRPILKVAIYTGMRRGEILGLKWDQVDFLRSQIRVERTKSGRTRFIPINSELMDTLKELKKRKGGGEYLFPNPESGRSLQDVKTAFKAACRRAGIKRLRFHDLRHTFGTRLVEAGIDLITVKALMGHSTVTVTERYTHSSQVSKRDAVEALTRKPPQEEGRLPVSVPTVSPPDEEPIANDLSTAN